jgi:hypothetical protein
MNTPVGLACETAFASGSRRIIAMQRRDAEVLGADAQPRARRVCLQTAFLSEARPDRRNVRLGIAKRVRRRMDRIVPQDEIVLVRSSRAENELGVGQRFEFDRFARRLESREVPVPQFVRRRQDARCDGVGSPPAATASRAVVASSDLLFHSAVLPSSIARRRRNVRDLRPRSENPRWGPRPLPESQTGLHCR